VKYITISGIDKSGKTSVIESFLERTRYRDYIVDRDPSNIFALNYIQNRWLNEDSIKSFKDYDKFIEKYKHSVDLAVLLVTNISILKQRFINSNEPELVGDYSIHEHQKIIINFFHGVDYPNSIIIDTGCTSLENTVNLLIDKTQELYNADK